MCDSHFTGAHSFKSGASATEKESSRHPHIHAKDKRARLTFAYLVFLLLLFSLFYSCLSQRVSSRESRRKRFQPGTTAAVNFEEVRVRAHTRRDRAGGPARCLLFTLRARAVAQSATRGARWCAAVPSRKGGGSLIESVYPCEVSLPPLDRDRGTRKVARNCEEGSSERATRCP